MEDKKDKRVLRVELDDDVKTVSITGTNGDEKVVMRQELNEQNLELITGGGDEPCNKPKHYFPYLKIHFAVLSFSQSFIDCSISL